jgi:transposase
LTSAACGSGSGIAALSPDEGGAGLLNGEPLADGSQREQLAREESCAFSAELFCVSRVLWSMSTEAASAGIMPDDPTLLKQIIAEQEAELAAARRQIETQQAELAAASQRIESASVGANPASADELSLCRAIIAQQQGQLAASQRKIEALEQRLHYLLRRLYMPRSERLTDPNQKSLFALDAAAEATTTVATCEPAVAETAPSPATKKRKGHGRRRFPADAERRRIPLDIDEKDKTCPCCGKPRRVIGEVVTERLGIEPPRFYVNQYVQLKYACGCEASGVVTAEKPIQPIERGNAEPELVAFVAVSRFDDHSPYYRQEHGQFKRAGIELPRSTLGDWMRQIGQLGRPLRDLMHTRVLLSQALGSDDTPVQLLAPGQGKTRQTYLWGWRGDDNYPYNVFDFTLGHGAAGPLRFLRREEGRPPGEGFCGYLQTDAFSSYDPVLRLPGIVGVGCWAHARRKIFEAKETNLAVGLEALARIAQLYEVEEAARKLSPAERLALRQERSVPLLASLKTWFDAQYAVVLPRSAMGQAIGYALGNWEALLRYTGDPAISIDNNAVERMLRIVGIGRKNWLYFGSERGGETAAVLFTLLSSAKRHGLNTWAYLRDLLWRLADLKPGELEQLLPDRWQDSRGR